MNSRARFQNYPGDGTPVVEMRHGQSAVLGEVPARKTRDAPDDSSLSPTSGFRTILVPLDGSLLAEHALPRALAIARRSGAMIRLAHVYSPLASEDPWQLHSRHFLVDIDHQRVDEKQAYLKEVARRIARRDAVRVVTLLSESDRVSEQLGLAARGADLIVMASHAWGRFGRLWHGSMADELIQKVQCPLLLVRGYSSPVDLTGDPIPRKVLVPLDGSSFSEHILPHAAAIGQISGAEVTLLYVESSERPNPQIANADALAFLSQMAESWKHRLGAVSTRVVRTDEKTAQAVLSFAAQHDVDLVALTARGRGSWARFTRDHIAAAVQRAGMAVLIVHPDEAHAKGALKS